MGPTSKLDGVAARIENCGKIRNLEDRILADAEKLYGLRSGFSYHVLTIRRYPRYLGKAIAQLVQNPDSIRCRDPPDYDEVIQYEARTLIAALEGLLAKVNSSVEVRPVLLRTMAAAVRLLGALGLGTKTAGHARECNEYDGSAE